MKTCDDIGEKLSGYLDGELTHADRQRIEIHLETCDRCRREHDELAALQKGVAALPQERFTTEEWSEVMNDVPTRVGRGLGWLSYVVGLLIVIGYTAFELARDDEVPALLKGGIAALVVGIVLLFLTVFLQRLKERKSDRYTEVEK